MLYIQYFYYFKRFFSSSLSNRSYGSVTIRVVIYLFNFDRSHREDILVLILILVLKCSCSFVCSFICLGGDSFHILFILNMILVLLFALLRLCCTSHHLICQVCVCVFASAL